MPSHYPLSRWWMSQRISCSSYQCSKKNPASLSHMPPANKSLRFPLRPRKGRIRESCIVKANHFFAELPDKDLHQYDLYSFYVSDRHIARRCFKKLSIIFLKIKLEDGSRVECLQA
uniref:Uncharacterized protein n=1 Tax=Helianthus annuus TaxID=4232 RepID=A0A251TIB3_HELAN